MSLIQERPARSLSSPPSKKVGAPPSKKKGPTPAVLAHGLADLPPARRRWSLAVKVGAGVSLLLLAALALCPTPAANRLVRPAGSVPRGMEFAAAGFIPGGGAGPLWNLLGSGSPADYLSSVSPTSGAPGKDASEDSNSAAAVPSTGERGAPRKDAAGAGNAAAVASGPSRASVGSSSRSPSSRARDMSPTHSSSVRGPIAAGVKHRTSVAFALEEEKSVKAAIPKPRIKVTDPISLVRPLPVYPPDALKKGEEGVVRVHLLVSAAGTVSRIEIAESNPPGVFDQIVEETLKQWRFTPARDQDGKPMDSWEMDQELAFKLQGSK